MICDKATPNDAVQCKYDRAAAIVELLATAWSSVICEAGIPTGWFQMLSLQHCFISIHNSYYLVKITFMCNQTIQ